MQENHEVAKKYKKDESRTHPLKLICKERVPKSL